MNQNIQDSTFNAEPRMTDGAGISLGVEG